jgi:excisionase family DNA binding protein
MMSKQLLTQQLALRAKCAAKLLGISERTLWTLTQSGEIPAKRIGDGPRKTALYSVAALQAWLAGETDTSTQGEN